MRHVSNTATGAAPLRAARPIVSRTCTCGTHTVGGTCEACRSKPEGKPHSLQVSDEDRRPTVTLDTKTQALGPVAPPSSNLCTPTAKFTSIPSGKIAATTSGGKLGAPFKMEAAFDTPIPCTCSCGEYRQHVRGYFKANGTTVTHNLCSNTLDPSAWHEDCGVFGGTTYKYGYRSIPFSNSRFADPDQATGCTFTGKDHPGLTGASGDKLEVHLEFKGALVDTCDSDRELKSSSWSVEGTATLP